MGSLRICTYIVPRDYGFAPNPFGGYCTLAACTPNHLGVRLSPGDWLARYATAQRGNGLIYAMRVSEVLDFDDYFYDRRFEHKKPRFDRTWREECGDSIYHRRVCGGGEWTQIPTRFHGTPEDRAKDIKYPRVFVSEHFYYFGRNAPAVPERFEALIWERQGTKCSHSQVLAEAFVGWLQSSFDPGVHGDPLETGSEPVSIGRKPG